MLKLEQYYRINEAAGVHIQLQSEGRVSIQVCTLVAGGNELQMDKKITGLNLPGQLKEHLPAGSVIALNLSGKGILQKRIEKVERIDQNILNAMLPNAKLEEFYIQHFPSGEFSFISLVRRTEADKWISQLKDYAFKPLMLSLGLFPVDAVIPLLNVYEGEFPLNGYRIQRNEKGEWTGCQPDDSAHAVFPVKLAAENLDEQLISPYAVAFQLVLGDRIEPVKADVGSLEAALQTTLSTIKIRAQSVMVLLLLFVALLVNFLVYSSLNSSNQTLMGQVSHEAKNSSDQQDINEQVKNKEDRLKLLGWDGGVDKSELIDKIAALLPPEIALREILVNPVDQGQSRTQKSLAFDDRKIEVTGISQQVIPVNEWIARVKTKSWVKDIRLANFAYNNELNTGQFTVTINY
jgi:Tfp pilus assembly protein PilN